MIFADPCVEGKVTFFWVASMELTIYNIGSAELHAPVRKVPQTTLFVPGLIARTP